MLPADKLHQRHCARGIALKWKNDCFGERKKSNRRKLDRGKIAALETMRYLIPTIWIEYLWSAWPQWHHARPTKKKDPRDPTAGCWLKKRSPFGLWKNSDERGVEVGVVGLAEGRFAGGLAAVTCDKKTSKTWRFRKYHLSSAHFFIIFWRIVNVVLTSGQSFCSADISS